MNIASVNNANFKGLNFSNVSTADRVVVKKNFKELKELANNYDIRLTSCYSGIRGFSSIDVDVKYLKAKLNFFQRLFPKRGQSIYKLPDVLNESSENSSILDSVREAINDLKRKG